MNQEIDRQTDGNIRHYGGAGREAIQERIVQLDMEWDVEHVLEVNASSLALTGLALGIAVDKKWLALPAVAFSRNGAKLDWTIWDAAVKLGLLFRHYF